MTDDWNKMSEEQLRQKAELGFHGQGAIVEILARTGKDQKTVKRVTWAILICTLLLLVAAAITIYLQVYPRPEAKVETNITTPPKAKPEKPSGHSTTK